MHQDRMPSAIGRIPSHRSFPILEFPADVGSFRFMIVIPISTKVAVSRVRLSTSQNPLHSGLISVEKILRDSQCFLVLTMSVSDCPPSNCAGEVSPLEPPVATLDAHQPPSTMAKIPLLPSTTGKPKWQATWTTPISSVWLPPQFTVNF